MSLLAPSRLAAPTTLWSTVSRSLGLASAGPWLPAGRTLQGRLFRCGLEPATGVPWLDEPGVVDARVGLAYAPGRSGGGPAVATLVIRLAHPGGVAGDLVLRGGPRSRWVTGRRDTGRRDTGRRVTGRRRAVHTGPGPLLVSVPSYDVAGRPLALAARPCGAETFELLVALDREPWRPFADLRVRPRPLDDRPLRPDPVARPLPGLRVARPGPDLAD